MKTTDQNPADTNVTDGSSPPQRITVFQQNGSGESKIKGVRQHGAGNIVLDVFSIDDPLPPIIDDTSRYLPGDIQADLVLDFLKHPDLSQELAARCRALNIPVVASGKKTQDSWPHTPHT